LPNFEEHTAFAFAVILKMEAAVLIFVCYCNSFVINNHFMEYYSHRRNLRGQSGANPPPNPIFFLPKNSFLLSTELKRGK
jgi:hypothetical protein